MRECLFYLRLGSEARTELPFGICDVSSAC